MTYGNANQVLILLVQSVAVVLSASYFQKEYFGYLFTIPGFNDEQRRTQTDAHIWCNQNGSQLLAITNSSIQDAVVAFINDAYGQNQVTGNTIITDGKRTTGDWIWLNESYKSPLKFGGQDGGLSYSYAYMLTAPSGFSLSAMYQSDINYYICEGQTFCTSGYRIQGQCFLSFNDETLSWYEARNRCLLRGGDLATFEFIADNNDLNSLNGSWLRPSTRYWIGIRRERWTWLSTSSDVTYSDWSEGRPVYDLNQDCLCLVPLDSRYYPWKWSECQCTQFYQDPFSALLSPPFPTTSPTILPSYSTQTTTTTIRPLPPPPTYQFICLSQGTITTSTLPTPYNMSFSSPKSSIGSTGDAGSSLIVGLVVGLCIGVTSLLIILILTTLLIRQTTKLRDSESRLAALNGEATNNRRVDLYESLQPETRMV